MFNDTPMPESLMTLKQRKQYRKQLLEESERAEIEERQDLNRRIRYASQGVKCLAMYLHMRKWVQFYTLGERNEQERLIHVWGFAPNDFELLPSGD